MYTHNLMFKLVTFIIYWNKPLCSGLIGILSLAFSSTGPSTLASAAWFILSSFLRRTNTIKQRFPCSEDINWYPEIKFPIPKASFSNEHHKNEKLLWMLNKMRHFCRSFFDQVRLNMSVFLRILSFFLWYDTFKGGNPDKAFCYYQHWHCLWKCILLRHGWLMDRLKVTLLDAAY